MLVLFDTPAGHALFTVRNARTLAGAPFLAQCTPRRQIWFRKLIIAA
jgi:hypothetical protein